jgi:hypothetical protein
MIARMGGIKANPVTETLMTNKAKELKHAERIEQANQIPAVPKMEQKPRHDGWNQICKH